ncbi:SGNH/GDSL hydrolase family protein [Verrucomicrobiaceae bacterium 5K15]|uniref:SGNH/GDSL hydrolase family protein n=1 Tax=Oceaniferula flava TaxID=2800421 RepID=A0AAE2SBM4_9BACT|nr:SGNH/GDSL hydrolase family protein [Oceaniferula flavus]MBK1853510.1 SGNH/GDSL hydrolase family protein [Oceaniferula flavus]MBM1134815.1 SGNH/GDSL hydrolase family protein [Oceaniferula flavus]
MKLILWPSLFLLLFSSLGWAEPMPLKKGERLVFLGDSITQDGIRPEGYITLVADAIAKRQPYLGVKVIGAGVSGNRIAHCLARLERDVLKKDPTLVVVYIGINDVWHWTHPLIVSKGGKGTTPEEFDAGLRKTIQRIKAKGAKVILCTPTVIGEKSDGSNPLDKQLDQYSAISRKVAAETDTPMLDLRKHFLGYLAEHNPDNVGKGILTYDGVHLTQKGNRYLADLMLQELGVTEESAKSE